MAQENQIETAHQKARGKLAVQDKTVPFLINRNNGRLLPNVVRLRSHKDMIPYRGSVKANLEDRMRYLRTGGARRDVAMSEPVELPPFDVSTASKDELITFAQEEFKLELNPQAPLHIMRNQILKAAKEAEDADATSSGPQEESALG